ncbi:hypothetical protein HDU98_009154 [Podochytrium sp. JEL0797]|nr:hypothetical protein HDU98_009154 [Podochytrium sp. JEL0797]
MRAVVFEKANTIAVHERKDPEPSVDEVRIRVKAFGVNFADILARMGIYPDAPPFPNIVGYEVSGLIDAVGPNIPTSWIGKPVVALTKFGGSADTVVTKLAHCIEKPAGVSYIEAASIPVVYLTAWMLVVHMGGLREGQVVLIQNAGSGVGLAAIDIARHLGAISIGTASASKHAFLASRGLDHAIDYRTQDFVAEVKRLTGGKGADLIIDPIGGRDSWNKNYGSLRRGGKLGVFGASSMQETLKGAGWSGLAWIKIAFSMMLGAPSWGPLKLMEDNAGVFGVNLGHMFEDLEYPVQWLKIAMKGIEEGWVRPHIDSVWDMDHVLQSHEHIEARRSTGKVIIVIDPTDPVHDMSKFKFMS